MALQLQASLAEIASQVSQLLHKREETVAVVETVAGGLISASLLSKPNASRIFRGGIIAYTLESRVTLLDWTEANVQNYKGPTVQVVSDLAISAREKLRSTYAIAESGTAGPSGGNSLNRTPGYVALAIASPAGVISKALNTGTSDRESNMAEFATEALRYLHAHISDLENR